MIEFFKDLQNLEIFRLFERSKRNGQRPYVGALVAGLDAQGNRIRTIREGREFVPGAEGEFVHDIGEGAIEINLTHGDGEAVVIIRRNRPVLLTVDTAKVQVHGAYPLKDDGHDPILAYELKGRSRPVRLTMTSDAEVIHGALHGFEITATR